MSGGHLIRGTDALAGVASAFREGRGPGLWRTGNKAWDALEIGPGLIPVIGAPPKRGKTALCMQIVADILAHNPNLTAYIANVELSPSALMMRLLARASGLAASDLRFGLRWRDSLERLALGETRLSAISDRLVFYVGPFALDALRQAFSEAGAGPGLLVIDYLQRLRLVSGEAPKDTRIELESVMTALRGLADAGLGIIAISAVARARSFKGSDYETLGLASLRGSSEIEYGADSVWLLHGPDDEAGTSPGTENMLVFECAANRHGDTARIPLAFNKKLMTFNVIEGTKP
jgi:replicative DNA helicase